MQSGLAMRWCTVGALVWAASGCGGRTIGVSNSEPTNAPQCNGCVFTHSDNPVLTGDVELSAASTGLEQAIRLDDSSWRFDHFQLTLSETGGNASQGSVNGGGDPYAGPVPWPSKRGTWIPSANSPVTMPWEAHGVRVGYANLDINVQKLDPNYQSSVPLLGTRVRLYPKTILVPIQVAQLVPDYASAPHPTITAPFGLLGNDVLFDDHWDVSLTRSSHNGIFRYIIGTFAPKADASGTGSRYEQQTLPDQVFRQCDIQFRMIQFVKVPVPRDVWELVNHNDQPVCSTLYRVSKLRKARRLAVEAGLNPSLPIVLFTNELTNPACVGGFNTILEEACLYPSCADGASWAAITPYHLGDSPYVLSHELGHMLGLLDLPGAGANTPNKWCLGPPNVLMCPYASEVGPAFTDTTQAASCELARKGAAHYSNIYYGTGFSE